MAAGKFDQIHQQYLARLLNYGTEAEYIYKDETIRAVIEDVERSGQLKLRKTNGDHIYADLKEITFLL